MKEEIKTLIALQELDMELAGFDRETAKVRQNLADREQAVTDKEALAVQCREKAASLGQSKHAIKAVSKEAEERIKERQIKMMQVQTSREHQALLKEIEEAKKQIKESSEQLLQVEEQAEAEEARAAELENLCKGEKKLLAEAAGKTEEEAQNIAARRAAVLSRRSELAHKLPAAQMNRYEKLLKKRKGLAVVKIVDAVCQGCFMAVPPQLHNEIFKGEEICSCPSCQRILYWPPPDDDSEAEAAA